MQYMVRPLWNLVSAINGGHPAVRRFHKRRRGTIIFLIHVIAKRAARALSSPSLWSWVQLYNWPVAISITAHHSCGGQQSKLGCGASTASTSQPCHWFFKIASVRRGGGGGWRWTQTSRSARPRTRSYETFSLFKPGAGQDIALHASPAPRNSSFLIFAFPNHSNSFPLILFKLKVWREKWIRHFFVIWLLVIVVFVYLFAWERSLPRKFARCFVVSGG